MSEQSAREKSRGAVRWVVLALVSLVVFANYYLPGAEAAALDEARWSASAAAETA